MVTDPEVTGVERFANSVRVSLHLPAELEYFAGHFPECPLLPGVVQIGWAIGHGRKHFCLGAPMRRLTAVKFMRVIEPGANIALLLNYDAEASRLSFEYQENGVACSSGNIVFAA
jgi:3-hydroxymyristoyl/3-hydroxydecanoyl-(acyl carrier protein) dehydratase